jgi:hypothetical protein
MKNQKQLNSKAKAMLEDYTGFHWKENKHYLSFLRMDILNYGEEKAKRLIKKYKSLLFINKEGSRKSDNGTNKHHPRLVE